MKKRVLWDVGSAQGSPGSAAEGSKGAGGNLGGRNEGLELRETLGVRQKEWTGRIAIDAQLTCMMYIPV